jgi:hypothetical protein
MWSKVTESRIAPFVNNQCCTRASDLDNKSGRVPLIFSEEIHNLDKGQPAATYARTFTLRLQPEIEGA